MTLKPSILGSTFVRTDLPRDLGDGLVMRHATEEDAGSLAQFNGWVHGRDHFDDLVAAWTRDFCSTRHPTCGPSNVLIVEDTHAGGKIVSSVCLIPQTWTYGGIPFEVGRPEAVGTDAAYRRRGLVARQFEVLHAMSAQMGHRVQAITGIPWFYRQFGYEFALNLGGGRLVPFTSIPPLKEGESEPFHLRPMRPDDVPFVGMLYQRDCARSLIACPRPQWLWDMLLSGYSQASSEKRPFQIVETSGGRAVGYVAPWRELWQDMYTVNEIAVAEGESLRAVMPSVLRGLVPLAEAEAAAQKKKVNTFFFQLGPDHPLYRAVPEQFTVERARYGWYMRVPDVPAFLLHIAPVLEQRLAQSPLAGHTGELKINEYAGGLRLAFEKGKLVAAGPWSAGNEDYRAGFPPGVFLKLLFGFNTLAELRAVYPDVVAVGEEQVLLEILFPRQHSYVIPVG